MNRTVILFGSSFRNPTFLNESSIVGEALFKAVRMGFSKSVGIILAAGVSPNLKRGYFEETALHVACWKQCTETMLVLLKCNAEVNAEDNRKKTALHHASLKGNIENMRLLLQNGAMINAVDIYGRTPLSLAVEHSGDEPSVVQVLLSAGAEVDISDEYDMTPLRYALEYNLPQVIRLLLRHKADANIKDKDGNTMLHFLFVTLDEDVPKEIFRELVKGGARVNSLNNQGHSPLYYAIYACDVEATQKLLRCGASFDMVEYLELLDAVRRHNDVRTIAQELIRYNFIKYPLSLKSTRHQQLRQEKAGNLLSNISSRRCNLMEFQQACLSEVEALSKVICDCGKSSIWGSINNSEECYCDTHQAILKLLFSGRKSNFTDAFFYELDEVFLLEVSLTLTSYFAFKESKKRLILPWPCMKEIQRYMSFEDAVSFIQSKQSEMDVSEFEKYQAFMKGESSVKSSSEISLPGPKRLRVS